jgi:hypothetical protein
MGSGSAGSGIVEGHRADWGRTVNQQINEAIDHVVAATEHVDTTLMVRFGTEDQWPKKVKKFKRKMHNHEEKVVKRMTQLAKQVEK